MLPNKLEDLKALPEDCLPIGIACLIKKGVIEMFSLLVDGEQACNTITPNTSLDIYFINTTIEDMIRVFKQEGGDSKLTIVLHGNTEELSIVLN